MRDSSLAKDVRVPLDGASVPRWGMRPAVHRDRILRGTSEPPSVALFRHVFNPLVIVLALFVCMIGYGVPATAQYVALGALTFIVASQIVSGPVLERSAAGPEPGMLRVLRHRIFAEWLLVIAVLLVLAFAFKVTEAFAHQVILTWFAIVPLAVLVAQSALRRFTAFTALRGKGAQTHIIVGANETGLRLAHRLMANPHLGTFRGFFDNRSSERLPDAIGEEQLLGSMADIRDYVQLNPVSNIYICLPIRTEQRVLRLMEQLKDTTASVYFVPDIFGFDLIQAQVSDVDGIPVLAICETPFCGMNGVLKRASDIVLSIGLLLVLWPVLLAIAAGVRMTSPGPAVFCQRRYGLYGDAFDVYKFRTMTVCEDRMLTQARPDDPRVTPFGRFLRRTSLDELPQLFNVLLGSMSLVGPRPHAVNQNEEYRQIIQGYMLRHKVRPGITGWAQVNGLRGETRTVDKMRQRVEYDLDYLRHWSLSLDLHILLRTALLVLRDRNAY